MNLSTSCSQEKEGILQEIENLKPWFHNLHLPGGIQTAPNHALGDFPSFKWKQLARDLPVDLSGSTVLDIGCNAGYYSIEMARRGAQVHAIDMNPHYLQQAQWAAGQFGLRDKIEFTRMQVYDLARSSRQYDLVLFLGVFYHLRYPLLGLEIVSRKVRKLLALQSLTMPDYAFYPDTDSASVENRQPLLAPGWPKMAFIEHRLSNDPTNWWVPNPACIEAMVRSCGLSILSRPAEEMYLCTPDPTTPAPPFWHIEEYQAATGASYYQNQFK